MVEIYAYPEDLGAFHDHRKDGDMHMFAKNDDVNTELYIQDNDGTPEVVVMVNGVEVEREGGFADSDELEEFAQEMIDMYLEDDEPQGFQAVSADEEDDIDEEFLAYQEEIEDNEYTLTELLDGILRFLTGDEEVDSLKDHGGIDYRESIQTLRDDVLTCVWEKIGLPVRPLLSEDLERMQFA